MASGLHGFSAMIIALFDPWGISPTISINGLSELYEKIY